MKEHMPDRYDAQIRACAACHSDYIIPGTPFSTVTLNRDVTATFHTDKGDYRPGMGVIAATWAERAEAGWRVVTENSAEGGILVFPKYRVAVKIRTQDLLLCDVHECHGVTPVVGKEGAWARMSFVFYLRERMNTCESPADEIARASSHDTKRYKSDKWERAGKNLPFVFASFERNHGDMRWPAYQQVRFKSDISTGKIYVI